MSTSRKRQTAGPNLDAVAADQAHKDALEKERMLIKELKRLKKQIEVITEENEERL